MAGRKICPYCKYSNDENDYYCRYCKQEILSVKTPEALHKPAPEKPSGTSSSERTCPGCGSKLAEAAGSCEQCGWSSAPAAAFYNPGKRRVCPSCGRQIRHDSIFCEYCGMRLVGTPSR